MNDSHQPRKRFGQNFLIDTQIIDKIVNALNIQPLDNLVEIGAGTGALTSRVHQLIPHFHVIEIDNDLVERLKSTYSDSEVTIHHQDALDFDFNRLANTSKPLRVFGNLPYNISTPLLFHILLFAPAIENMIFMLQKEVVMRMCAQVGAADYGRLSIMIQYACETSRLFDIPPTAFNPPPKVMSSLIFLKPYTEDRPHPKAKHYATFANVVNVAFQHRRKTLKNALHTCVAPEIFDLVGIDPSRRPETLTISEYVTLSNAIASDH
ncbi:MAG: 16S rRNA (adenine(1518)-N(6)/adenine(1519)-N(6))-dimethyltransferase RsmA [Candidatus Berkiella sp.]